MTAANVYETILRKLLADPETALIREDTPDSNAIVVVDTSWVSLNRAEADALEGLRDADA